MRWELQLQATQAERGGSNWPNNHFWETAIRKATSLSIDLLHSDSVALEGREDGVYDLPRHHTWKKDLELPVEVQRADHASWR